jgi:hypothetical protein
MSHDWENAFRSYVDMVQARFLQSYEGPSLERPLELVKGSLWMRDAVEAFETGNEFSQLVQATSASFQRPERTTYIDSWKGVIKNFFRRSGYYLNAFKKKPYSLDELVHAYLAMFEATESRIRYLAPLEYVQFGKTAMDFGAFKIQHFTMDELSAIFQNPINEVFYPRAAFNVGELQPYWFIDLTITEPISTLLDPFRTPIDYSGIGRVAMQYTNYGVLEPILQRLALYNWEPIYSRDDDDEITPWSGFHVPFVLSVSSSLLHSPTTAPDLSALSTEPDVDSYTGEELGEVPIVLVSLNEIETDRFEAFIHRTGRSLSNIRGKHPQWEFVDIALDFVGKAFFAQPLEQLLWHITALEALLGEETNVTETLARRVALITGKTQREKTEIRKQVKQLYRFRSSLVHGKTNLRMSKIHQGHLRKARNFSRGVLVWFLSFLSAIQDHFGENVPTRDELYTLLELSETSRIRLGQLITIIPAQFPNVSEWME